MTNTTNTGAAVLSDEETISAVADKIAMFHPPVTPHDAEKNVRCARTIWKLFGRSAASPAPVTASQPVEAVPDAWKLAMAVLQSDLYAKLEPEEVAICDALVSRNPYTATPTEAPASQPSLMQAVHRLQTASRNFNASNAFGSPEHHAAAHEFQAAQNALIREVLTSPITAPASGGEALHHNFTTHRSAWRDALIKCRDSARPSGVDHDERGYWEHEIAAYDEAFDSLAATKSGSVTAPAAEGGQQGYVIALQTVVETPNSRPSLGYTLMDGVGIFPTEAEAHGAIKELCLPLGWVSMKVSQLLPGMQPLYYTIPATEPVKAEAAQAGSVEIEIPKGQKGYRPAGCDKGGDLSVCCSHGCAADQERAELAARAALNQKGGA